MIMTPMTVLIPSWWWSLVFFPRFTGESGGSFSIANQLLIFVGSIFILLLKVFAHVVLVFHFPADYRFRLKKSRIASLSGAGWTYTAPMGGGLTRRQRWGCSVICLCQPRLTWRGSKNMEASTTRTNWRVSTKQTPEFETWSLEDFPGCDLPVISGESSGESLDSGELVKPETMGFYVFTIKYGGFL